MASLIACLAPSVQAATVPDMQVCFVPGPQDCASVAADAIAAARRSIDVQAYNFTEPQIAQALLDAHGRGVTVRLVADKSAPRERSGKTEVLAMAGVPVWVDYTPHIAHNKVMVIDSATVLTGSFNWTTSADMQIYDRLFARFKPIWDKKVKSEHGPYDLTADEIIAIARERLHPEFRDGQNDDNWIEANGA